MAHVYSRKRAEDRTTYVLRLTNPLSGWDWRLTHARPELAVTTFVANAERKPKDTVELFITVDC